MRKVELSYYWSEIEPIDKIAIDTSKTHIIMPMAKAKRLVSGNCQEVLSELRCVLERSAHEPSE